MRAMVLMWIVGVAAQVAQAASPSAPRPTSLFAVVDAAAPASELPRWQKTVVQIAPGAALPKLEELGPALGKLVGAPNIAGVDFQRPLHILFLNPQKHAQPILVLPAADAKKMAASLKGTTVEVRAKKGYGIIGTAAALAEAEAYAAGLLSTNPARGVHATVFFGPIWGAYGAQVRALMAMASSQQPSPFPGMAGLMDGVVSTCEQTERLTLDVGPEGSEMAVAMTMEAKPSSSLAKVFAAQKPSDFALLGKLSSQASPMIAAGSLDMSPVRAGFVDWMMGKSADAKLRAALDEMYSLWSGEFAMAGAMQSLTDISYQYLMGVRDAKRANELFPKMYEVFSSGGALGGAVKIERKVKPPFQHDGLTVSQSEMRYDFSGMGATYKGPKEMKATVAWTGWEKLIGFAMGPSPAESMKRLLDSARHQKDTLTLESSIKASVDRARAAKESLWIRLDFGKLQGASQATGAPPMPNIAPTMTLGFTPTEGRMRLLIPPRG